MLTKKHILLGISGGIAAYKMPDLVHALTKAGHEVKVILTKSAESFVSPLVLATLTKNRVWREEDFFAPNVGYQIPHISLVEWADLFVLCPATANTLHTVASGDASTLLGSTFVANTKPVLIFPAMNCPSLPPRSRKSCASRCSPSPIPGRSRSSMRWCVKIPVRRA